MARNKTEPTVNFDALRASLLRSKIQQSNPAFFQVVNQLLDMLKLNNSNVDVRIAKLEDVKPIPDVNNDTFITAVSEPNLPNSFTLADVLLRGTRANQPAATDVPNGTLYYVTDETKTEQSDGAAWNTYADATAGAITGSGTAGQLARFTAATVIANADAAAVSAGLDLL